METISKKNGTARPGPDGTQLPLESVTLKQVEDWTKVDLSMCISFLNAIHSDPDLLKQVASWMHGRLQNQLHKPETPPK